MWVEHGKLHDWIGFLLPQKDTWSPAHIIKWLEVACPEFTWLLSYLWTGKENKYEFKKKKGTSESSVSGFLSFKRNYRLQSHYCLRYHLLKTQDYRESRHTRKGNACQPFLSRFNYNGEATIWSLAFGVINLKHICSTRGLGSRLWGFSTGNRNGNAKKQRDSCTCYVLCMVIICASLSEHASEPLPALVVFFVFFW